MELCRGHRRRRAAERDRPPHDGVARRPGLASDRRDARLRRTHSLAREATMMTTTDPTDLGLDPVRLERLTAAIESDVAAELYDGAVVLVARVGQVALHDAIGLGDRA